MKTVRSKLDTFFARFRTSQEREPGKREDFLAKIDDCSVHRKHFSPWIEMNITFL